MPSAAICYRRRYCSVPSVCVYVVFVNFSAAGRANRLVSETTGDIDGFARICALRDRTMHPLFRETSQVLFNQRCSSIDVHIAYHRKLLPADRVHSILVKLNDMVLVELKLWTCDHLGLYDLSIESDHRALIFPNCRPIEVKVAMSVYFPF